MAQRENLLRRIGRMLHGWWGRGLDDHNARRAFDRRARRVFEAIMTERCAECLAPVTLCRKAH